MQKLATGLVLWLTALVAGFSCGSDPRSADESSPAPRTVSTQVPEGLPTELVGIATEFASGGAFNTTDEAEEMVGYRLLRPDPSIIDTSVAPGRQGGLVDVFPEIGLPRARQSYTLLGRNYSLSFTQEPATYRTTRYGRVSDQRFGDFDGVLLEEGDSIGFEFLTGETSTGFRSGATSQRFGGTLAVIFKRSWSL